MTSLDLDLDEYYAGADDEPDPRYKDSKEYRIMKNFLQPDSTMCLEAAAESLLELIPEHCGHGGVVGIITLCANVVPWDHTSHLKLAYLSERLRWSPKMSPSLGDIKSANDSYLTNVSFSDALWDDYDNAECYNPDHQSDLDQWVNFNAFLANLDALNFWRGESHYLYRTMAYTFKHPPEGLGGFYKDPNDVQIGLRGRDANVVAAAQWILWDGQNVRRLALYPRPPQGATLSKELYFNVESAATSLELWQIWKGGFKSASEEESASKESRDVALRAYTLMETLEKTMPS
ncbi:hypothetical protein CONLIGDRAFT_289437 [Coniochaeta ligniaria NRRL 30616]|uniref:Uncharacterized protein n=1 Tax=Coniochaeta ligniaria NRRL 30616 TaxID=1408157 RepID=A0A1J7ISV5_9PEZI|nr:hypothetical protein CONLIGDRAFT_289437 [Coniochaeta ligniaria NRRL 30616]